MCLVLMLIPVALTWLAGGDNIFRSIPNEDSHANQFTLKLDHRINDKQSLQHTTTSTTHFDAQPFTRFQAATPTLCKVSATTMLFARNS